MLSNPKIHFNINLIYAKYFKMSVSVL
jgi:hypothetical protein